jgi:hypothetical protein
MSIANFVVFYKLLLLLLESNFLLKVGSLKLSPGNIIPKLAQEIKKEYQVIGFKLHSNIFNFRDINYQATQII